MEKAKKRPGPLARSAFRSGIVAAGVLWFAGAGMLYWLGLLTPVLAAYLFLLLFPVYLVVAAAVLNVWLGYGKDATDLRPVYREKQS